MPLISKPNYNQIFASQAPEQDKPAVFNNYPEGWGVESRPNNGKPTIKGFNYLQQTSDLKDLWILQNGACLPYDESIEYANGAPVLKDGVIQYKTASGFKSRDAVTIPTYNNAADGVDPVTGVADGAYFNVRSASDESYIDEYQNIGGVPTPSGKSCPSAEHVQNVAKPMDGPLELRNYTGSSTSVRFTAKGVAGLFQRAAEGVIRDDNFGTVIVDGLGRVWERIFSGPAYAEWFGANGYGDDADALLRWLNSGEQDIQLTTGVSYYTSKPLPIPETVRSIIGNFAGITYDREKTTFLESSLLNAHYRSSPITIERVSLKYTGTFDYGSSYGGTVCGIDISTLSGCSGVTIREVTASGFNWAGVAVGRFGSFSNPDSYLKNVTIEGCNLHGNRVAGLWYGWVDGIAVLNNTLEFNGKSGDIGTGYGCAAASDAYPKNINVSSNFANYNWRKGIDFHAGYNITASNNQCRGNLLHGIEVQARNDGNGSFPLQPVGSVIISGNLVSDMISPPGVYCQPLAFYTFAPDLNTYPAESYLWKTSVKITGNIVANCRSGVTTDAAIIAAINGLADVVLTISDNSIDVGDVGYMFSLSQTPTTPTHPAHKSIVRVSSNQISTKKCAGFVRYTGIESKTLFGATSNDFSIEEYALADGASGGYLLSGVIRVDFSQNAIKIANMSNFSVSMIRPDPTGQGHCNAIGNSLNGIRYPDRIDYVKRHISDGIPADNEQWPQGSVCEYMYTNGARNVPISWVVSTTGYAVKMQWTGLTEYAKGSRVFSGTKTFYASVGGVSGGTPITSAGVDGTVTWVELGPKAVFVPIYNAGPPAI